MCQQCSENAIVILGIYLCIWQVHMLINKFSMIEESHKLHFPCEILLSYFLQLGSPPMHPHFAFPLGLGFIVINPQFIYCDYLLSVLLVLQVHKIGRSTLHPSTHLFSDQQIENPHGANLLHFQFVFQYTRDERLQYVQNIDIYKEPRCPTSYTTHVKICSGS